MPGVVAAGVVVRPRRQRWSDPGAMTDSARLLGAKRGFDARLWGVVHMKVSAVVLFRFIDKKIFQNVLPVCWGERFFADSAMN